jgi:N-acyl-D-amino-acid deacylase
VTWALLTLLSPTDGGAQVPDFDILIRDGRVIDGTGNPWIRYDIGIRGDQIVAIGDLDNATARRVIDAGGLYVTPGFIDLHSHADRGMTSDNAEARRATSLVTQGLTTAVSASDGVNPRWPLSSEVAAYERGGIPINAVLMVGHRTVRSDVMGEDYEREATPDEIAKMPALVRASMEAGPWGLTAGLEYRPARFSTTQEVVALGKVVAEYGGFYIAHQRSEASLPIWQLPSQAVGWQVDGLQGLEETITIARETGIRVVASHHKARGRSSFGRSAYDTIVVNRARAEGLQVYMDVYPYETFGDGPQLLLPRWSLVDDTVDASGGQDSPVFDRKGIFANARSNLRRRWTDPVTRRLLERDIAWLVDHFGGADRIIIVAYPDPAYVGKSLDELARAQGKPFHQVVVDMALGGYDDMPGGVRLRGYGIHDVDIVNYIRQPYTATTSDASVGGVAGVPPYMGPGAHPRHFGNFVRAIARYVKDLQVVTLPFAIHAATALPAQIIGLKDRGLIREGYKADIVIFDLESLRDRATVLQPDLLSEGIEFVLVNGQFTVDGGKRTGAFPGTVLKRSGTRIPRP